MTVKTFGPAFSRALCVGCASLSTPEWPVPLEWTLAKLALESSFDPFAEHPRSHARGLWQPMPRERSRHPSLGAATRALDGPLDFTRTNRDGSASVMRRYSCPAPEVQIVEAFAFWRTYRGDGFRCREALYCANIAPARLRRPYDDDTIIYSADPADAHLPDKTYWPAAYEQNAEAFGLEPRQLYGKIRMRDLAVGLDAAVRRCRARYDAEVAAAYVVNAGGPEAA